METFSGDLAELLDQCRRDHRAWINGSAAGYELPEEGSIMGAVGGWAPGGATTAERQAAVAAAWSSGRGDVEFVNGGISGELAWIAFIERAMVVFAGDTAERRWDLRVTEVFRRTNSGWTRIHRHADAFVDRRPLEAVVALQ